MRVDLTGRVYGRWTVLGYAEQRRWLCRCACGNEKLVYASSLGKGSRSCGCGMNESRYGRRTNFVHGMWNTREYSVWVSMLNRCRNPRMKAYKNYGGRGITVCERWHRFENFYADMGPRPSVGLDLDRINNDGNYEPGNCRWTTRSENLKNTRRSPTKTAATMPTADQIAFLERVQRHGGVAFVARGVADVLRELGPGVTCRHCGLPLRWHATLPIAKCMNAACQGFDRWRHKKQTTDTSEGREWPGIGSRRVFGYAAIRRLSAWPTTWHSNDRL